MGKDEIISLFNYLIDNTFLHFGDTAFRQAIGIPTGTNCAVYVANLFRFAYELKFVSSLCVSGDIALLALFEHTLRYIDGVLSLNSASFAAVANNIYPPELQ